MQRDYTLQRASESLKERTYFKQNSFRQALSEYLQAKAWFVRHMKGLATITTRNASAIGRSAPTSVVSTQAALEKLRLPRFGGLHRDWEVFKEKFTSLIINDAAMDSTIKFQHLSNCLDGEEAEKLRGIPPKGDNFQTAWETLCKRYDNEALRFGLQMQAIVHLPSASTESSKHLGQLLNAVNESINTFKALSRPVENWDDIFVYFIVSKLAVSTRLDWVKEVERRKLGSFPKFSVLKDFLEDRLCTLDVVEIEKMDNAPPHDHKTMPSTHETSQAERDGKRTSYFKRAKSSAAHVA